MHIMSKLWSFANRLYNFVYTLYNNYVGYMYVAIFFYIIAISKVRNNYLKRCENSYEISILTVRIQSKDSESVINHTNVRNEKREVTTSTSEFVKWKNRNKSINTLDYYYYQAY